MVAAIVCSLLFTVSAYANPIQYTNRVFSTVPIDGLTYVKLDSRNCEISTSGDVIAEVRNPNTPYTTWFQVPVREDASGNFTYSGNGAINLKFTECGWDWRGRKVDCYMTIDQIRVNGNSNWIQTGDSEIAARDGYAYVAMVSTWCVEYVAASGGVDNTGSTMRVTIDVRYSNDGTRCPYNMGVYVSDIDVFLRGTKERIMLGSGFTNDVFIVGTDGQSNLDENAIRNQNTIQPADHLTGGNENLYDTAAYTMTSSYPAQFTWGGKSCGTDLNLRTVCYPYQYVDEIRKIDAEGVQFEGEKMKFTGEFTLPYCAPAPVDGNPIYCQAKEVRILDTLDAGLDASSATFKMFDSSGRDVSAGWTMTVAGQTVTIKNKQNGGSFPMGSYKLELTTKVKTGFDFSQYATVGIDGGTAYKVPNKLRLQLAEQYSTNTALQLTSNEAHGKVSWGWVEVNLGSANDSVSQLGQNSCYTLKGAQVGIYSDESCTQLVGTLTLDENGYGKSGRLPLGNYYLGEIKAPSGFAENPSIDTTVVKGLLVSTVARENVPQSEGLDGSIVSKRDKELMEAGFRLNPLLQAVNNLPLY